jgi:hypothetical protein
MHELKGLPLPRTSHSSEIAVAGSHRLRSTLAAAPVLFAQPVVTSDHAWYTSDQCLQLHIRSAIDVVQDPVVPQVRVCVRSKASRYCITITTSATATAHQMPMDFTKPEFSLNVHLFNVINVLDVTVWNPPVEKLNPRAALNDRVLLDSVTFVFVVVEPCQPPIATNIAPAQ